MARCCDWLDRRLGGVTMMNGNGRQEFYEWLFNCFQSNRILAQVLATQAESTKRDGQKSCICSQSTLLHTLYFTWTYPHNSNRNPVCVFNLPLTIWLNLTGLRREAMASGSTAINEQECAESTVLAKQLAKANKVCKCPNQTVHKSQGLGLKSLPELIIWHIHYDF